MGGRFGKYGDAKRKAHHHRDVGAESALRSFFAVSPNPFSSTSCKRQTHFDLRTDPLSLLYRKRTPVKYLGSRTGVTSSFVIYRVPQLHQGQFTAHSSELKAESSRLKGTHG